MKKKLQILNKNFNQPITCLTAYSAPIAKILDGIVDIVLIGDSLGTTLYGMKNSQRVSLDMMKIHGLAVCQNIKKSITVIDMPYKTYNSKTQAFKNAKTLLKFTKAKLLKLEINEKNLSVIKFLSSKNINIIAHIGVTPQSFKDYKKIKVVGKTDSESKRLQELALNVEKLGAKAILLECVTKETAKKISTTCKLPTIGIGSSKYCDGQVLVFDDLVKMDSTQHIPKFVKNYLNFNNLAKKAVRRFTKDVKQKKFPSKKYTY